MRTLLLTAAIVTAALAGGSAQAQSPAITAEPIQDVRFVNARLNDALSLIAKSAGITIEFDDSVPASQRAAKIGTIAVQHATVEEVVGLLAARVHLRVTVVDEKTIRIFRPVVRQ